MGGHVARARRAWRPAATAVLTGVVAAVTVGVAPAAAEVTWTTTSGYLQVRIDDPAGEFVSVTCSGGVARVNGTTTGLACASTVYVGVTGGPGPDTITVTGVGAAWGAGLSGGDVAVAGGGGDDTITGSPLGGNYSGDGGGDTILSQGGDSNLAGGPANDTLVGGGMGTTRHHGGPGQDSVHGGPGSDLVTVAFADLPDAGATGGAGYDNLVALTPAGPDHVVVVPRAAGGYDTVLRTAGAVQLLRVDPSFEAHNVQTGDGDDQFHVRGTAPDPDGGGPLGATSVTPSPGGGTDLLEVAMGGPHFSPAPGTYHRTGFGSVYFVVGETENHRITETSPDRDHAFVHDVQHDLAGRHREPAQVTADAAALTTGSTTRAAYAAALTRTDDWRGVQVDRVYSSFLRRAPDDDGRTFWIGRIASGRRIFDLRATVLASGEYFREQGGSSNAGYVDAVYRDVLGRAPDPGGRAYWIARLDGGEPRYRIGLTLYSLAEPLRAEVRYQFRALIGRDPSATESSTWTTRLRDRATGEQELHAFLAASAAYFGRTRP